MKHTCLCSAGYVLNSDGRTCTLVLSAGSGTAAGAVQQSGSLSNNERQTGDSAAGATVPSGLSVGTVAAIASSAVLLIGLVISLVRPPFHLIPPPHLVVAVGSRSYSRPAKWCCWSTGWLLLGSAWENSGYPLNSSTTGLASGSSHQAARLCWALVVYISLMCVCFYLGVIYGTEEA